MNPEEFARLTQHLIRIVDDRPELIPRERQCEYCPNRVVDQVIHCEPHKIGTPQQHFKHKCYECRHAVYDGSFKLHPDQLRPITNHTPKVPRIPRPPRVRGAPRGRPRLAVTVKPRPGESTRPVGRPRKTPGL